MISTLERKKCGLNNLKHRCKSVQIILFAKNVVELREKFKNIILTYDLNKTEYFKILF